MAVRFFHIGPDWTGQQAVSNLFRACGHQVVDHAGGRLAGDIAYHSAAGETPLTAWPEARLFTNLHRLDDWSRQPVEAWRDFAALDRHFPDAVFILPLRDPEGWIADRIARQDGRVARIYARFLGVPLGELHALWLAGWADHLAAVRSHFGDDPRLVVIDLHRETPADLAGKLSRWITLDPGLADADWQSAPASAEMRAALDRIEDDAAPAILRAQPRDAAYVADVAAFCLRGLTAVDAGLGAVSGHYAHWDGARAVTGRDGQPRPVAIGRSYLDGRDHAFSLPRVLKLERAEGVINDILALGRRDPVHMDMEDSRWMGSPQGDPLGAPVLVHNRREGARNPVLWPLPGFHDLGRPGWAPPDCPDPVPWADKIDRVVWRGNISGSVRRTDRVRPGRAAHVVLRDLARAGDDAAARAAVAEEVNELSRLRLVRRLIDHPDFDLGLVLAWGLRDFARDPLIAPYLRPRRGADYFHRFRYQLCLTGYDHGSNFIGAIDSQSVLLKEEDGWEVFYSGRFRPWVHYIPVARYCDDLEDKLAWARANPDACQAMSQAARAELRRLSDAAMRAEILHLILDGVAAAS